MGSRGKCYCDECRLNEYLERPTGRCWKWLKEHGLDVTKEQTYDELRSYDTGRKLRFDFCAYLEHEGKSYIWVIELDGIQHDEYSHYYHESYEDFEKQQQNHDDDILSPPSLKKHRLEEHPERHPLESKEPKNAGF